MGRVDGERLAWSSHAGNSVDVGEPGAMREQMADRDHVSARRDAGQVAFERVVQAQAALLHELEHDRRGERLRHAPDPELLVGAGLSASGGRLVLPAVVGDEDDHAIAAARRRSDARTARPAARGSPARRPCTRRAQGPAPPRAAARRPGGPTRPGSRRRDVVGVRLRHSPNVTSNTSRCTRRAARRSEPGEPPVGPR